MPARLQLTQLLLLVVKYSCLLAGCLRVSQCSGLSLSQQTAALGWESLLAAAAQLLQVSRFRRVPLKICLKMPELATQMTDMAADSGQLAQTGQACSHGCDKHQHHGAVLI